MKTSNIASAVILILTIFGIVAAQDAGIITAARVARAEGEMTGAVYATINGKETKIADAGVDSWVIQRGRQLVYSGRDGSGGYENEGMSLYVYDARTGRQRKIMSEYFMVEKVAEVLTRSGKTALLVELEDGGLGASYFAVVDPARGEVFFHVGPDCFRARATTWCWRFTKRKTGRSSWSQMPVCGRTELSVTISVRSLRGA